MHELAIKARLAVQVGHLYKKRNADREFVNLTRRARLSWLSALLRSLRRYPTCAAGRVAPKANCKRAEAQISIQQAAMQVDTIRVGGTAAALGRTS